MPRQVCGLWTKWRAISDVHPNSVKLTGDGSSHRPISTTVYWRMSIADFHRCDTVGFNSLRQVCRSANGLIHELRWSRWLGRIRFASHAFQLQIVIVRLPLLRLTSFTSFTSLTSLTSLKSQLQSPINHREILVVLRTICNWQFVMTTCVDHHVKRGEFLRRSVCRESRANFQRQTMNGMRDGKTMKCEWKTFLLKTFSWNCFKRLERFKFST